MPEYLSPGVYIEEIERGPRPIEGVPTSTAAFLGAAERGPTKPRLVTSYKDYQRYFGGVYSPSQFLPDAVAGFFENGGQRVYICHLAKKEAEAAFLGVDDNYIIRAAGPGEWGNRVRIKVRDSSTKKGKDAPIGFRISAAYYEKDPKDTDPFPEDGVPTLPRPQFIEEFDDLVLDENSPDFVGKRLPFIDRKKGDTIQGPDSSALFVLERKATAPADALPKRDNTVIKLQKGIDGKVDETTLTDDDYEGKKGKDRQAPQGLSALELDPYRDIALVYAPGVSDQKVVDKVISHCERMRFRFAVVDSERDVTDMDAVDPRVNLNLDKAHAAFYYPWLYVSDPSTGARKLVPPGGHVLGVYARSDAERGVFKAPANEIVRGALDVRVEITDRDQQVLNPRGVNAIRRFPGRGIRIWGARTLSSNTLWKYVSVRRLFIFLERSIYEGTQWVVFEPNDPRLWARVTDTVRLFLRNQWREGALFGRREEEAFFVSCNVGTTMSQDDILNGRLICEIGIAPVRPAEFVVFRIFQNTAEAQR